MVTGCVQCFFLPMDHAPGLTGWTGHVHHVLLYIFFFPAIMHCTRSMYLLYSNGDMERDWGLTLGMEVGSRYLRYGN